MKLTSLRDVLQHQLEDLRSAESQLVEALPKLADAASSEELERAFREHLEETRGHLQRVEEALGELGSAGSEECKGMKGLIAEGEEVVRAEGADPAAKDAALIAAAQRVEHYEIAAYGTARALADRLGLEGVRDLMEQTLDEEAQADTLLTKIATGGRLRSGVNDRAS